MLGVQTSIYEGIYEPFSHPRIAKHIKSNLQKMCCISDVPSRSRQSVEREVLSLAAAQMMPFPLMAALVGRVNFADKGSAENSPRIKLSNCIRLCAAAAGEKELSFTHTPALG